MLLLLLPTFLIPLQLEKLQVTTALDEVITRKRSERGNFAMFLQVNVEEPGISETLAREDAE